MQVTIEPVTVTNWRAAIALGVHPEQQRFVADHAPIAALALAKAYVVAGGRSWSPLLIRADGEAAGFVALAMKPAEPNECWLFHFFVDMDRQGEGIGRAATLALIEHIRALPALVVRINLTVHPENLAAQHLYHSAGFTETGDEIEGEPVYALAL